MQTQTNATKSPKLYWWIPILIGYGAALAFPAVYSHGFGAPTSGTQGGEVMGYEMLLKMPQVLMAPSWWANPLWWVGLVLYIKGKPRAALIFSIGALALASLVLIVGPFPPDQFQLSDLRVGYYIWLLSMIALVIAPCVQLFTRQPGVKADS